MAPLISSPGERGRPVSIMINEDFMSLEIIGAEITAAVRVEPSMARDGLVQAPDPQRGNHGGDAL